MNAVIEAALAQLAQCQLDPTKSRAILAALVPEHVYIVIRYGVHSVWLTEAEAQGAAASAGSDGPTTVVVMEVSK